MATLPGADQIYGERPTPRPSTSVAQIGATGQEGRSASFLGAAASEINQATEYMARAQQEWDESAVQDAANKLNQARLQQAYDPNDGFLAQKGAAAAAPDFTEKQIGKFQQSADEISATLQNPNQQRMFERQAKVVGMQQRATIYEHASRETIQHRSDINTSTVSTAKQSIGLLADPGIGILNPDPAKRTDQNRAAIDAEVVKAYAAIDNQARLTGKDDEASKGLVSAQKAQFLQGILTERVESVMFSDPIKATALFNMYESAFVDPEKKLLVQHKLREATLGVKTVNDADSIMREVRSAPQEPQSPDGFMKVSGDVQRQRDTERLAMLNNELKANPNDASLKSEIAFEESKNKWYDSATQAPQISTNGMPNSRDIRAQLPVMLSKVETYADQSYGTDKNNPERAAYVARLTNEIKGKVSLEVNQLEAVQKQAQGELITIVGGMDGYRPVTSFSQLQANPKAFKAWQLLDPQAKLGIQNLIESNASGKTGENNDMYWDVFKRIHLPPGDPQKIDYYQQILGFAGPDKLNARQLEVLRHEIDRDETPGGRSVNQLIRSSSATVAQQFKNTLAFTSQPDRQVAATMRWTEEAGKKIDAYAKAGKDARTLFMIDSPDSIVSQKYLQTFIDSTPAQGLAEQAAAIKTGSAPAVRGVTPEQVTKAPQLDASKYKTPAEAMAWMNGLPKDITMIRDETGKLVYIPGRKK